MSPGSIHSRTLESDSEDTVMSTSPLRPLRENAKSPLAPEGKRIDPKSLGNGSGGRGRKDSLSSRPRMQAVLLTGGSGKFRPNSILSIEEQPSLFPSCDSDSATDLEGKQEEVVKEGVWNSAPPTMTAVCMSDSSTDKERERGRLQTSSSGGLDVSSALDLELNLGLGLGLGLVLESCVSASSDALSLKIIATASTSSTSTLGSSTFFGKCLSDLETPSTGEVEGGGEGKVLGERTGKGTGEGAVEGGGEGNGKGGRTGAVPLPHRDSQHPP
jgi:hypothetical protein